MSDYLNRLSSNKLKMGANCFVMLLCLITILLSISCGSGKNGDSGMKNEVTTSLITEVKGVVYSHETKEPISGARISIKNDNPDNFKKTEPDGSFRLPIPASFLKSESPHETLVFVINHENFLLSTPALKIIAGSTGNYYELYLEPCREDSTKVRPDFGRSKGPNK